MNQEPPIFNGILAVFALSFMVLAMVPAIQLGSLQPKVDEDTNDIYPIDVAGAEAEGRAVYVSQGCIACHTEQVTSASDGADIARGWGVRRTVARDYIYENPPLLGYMRLGPDLANIGTRTSSKDPDKYSRSWHYLHLYAPELTSPGSIMPSYSFLFEKRKIVGQRDAEALDLPPRLAPPPGYQIVPTNQAKQLVGYLTTLDHSHPLPEAGPNAEPPKLAAAGGTAK